MEATLYKITIGTKNALILSINAADALESIDSKSGTRSLEVAGKAKFTFDGDGNITSYKLKSSNHNPDFGRNAIISHGVRASIAQESALSQKPVVLSQHETSHPGHKTHQRGFRSKKSHQAASKQKRQSPLNPNFFISTKPLGEK
jgi:hypothetical protein